MYACVKFICICKLFTSVYAFITNIRCIGMDFILVCTCISYIYFEHPIVYMYMWVIYRCICTCFMYVLISEVWFKSYMAPHMRACVRACKQTNKQKNFLYNFKINKKLLPQNILKLYFGVKLLTDFVRSTCPGPEEPLSGICLVNPVSLEWTSVEVRMKRVVSDPVVMWGFLSVKS